MRSTPVTAADFAIQAIVAEELKKVRERAREA